MKKRCIAVILLWVIITCFGLHLRSVAFAFSPVEAAAAATYAIGSSLGIDWTVTGVNSAFAQTWMETQIQNYDNGQALVNSIVDNIAVDAAGKLAIGQVAYNNICEFIDHIGQVYDVDMSLIGTNNTVFDPQNIAGSLNGWRPWPGGQINASNFYIQGWSATDIPPGRAPVSAATYNYSSTHVNYLTNYATAYYTYVNKITGQIQESGETKYYNQMGINSLQKQSFQFPEEYALPTVLNPDKEWSGLIGGESSPDTNLDQLIGSIFDNVADNNLIVDGDIEDVPVPPGPIPTWTPVDDVIDGINQTGEILDGIGNDIGNISGHLDDIGDQIGDITGALEGVQEGIHTQTGVISGALDQAAQDVVDAIGEQTAAIEDSLADTAEAAQEIAEALQPGEIEPKQFDLRRLFPFCIPFDIHNLLQKFNATPVAPHVQLPFVIQSLGFSYTFDLDFSAFDPVAQAMRTVEFIVFAIGLAWATSKVIKW